MEPRTAYRVYCPHEHESPLFLVCSDLDGDCFLMTQEGRCYEL